MSQTDPGTDHQQSAIKKRQVAYLNFGVGLIWVVDGFVNINGGRSGTTAFALSVVFFSLSVMWWRMAAKDSEPEPPR